MKKIKTYIYEALKLGKTNREKPFVPKTRLELIKKINELDVDNPEVIDVSNFDLSEINWERCESYALSNRVKFVCEEYEKYKPILTSELADILYMNKGVVNKYLQKGSMLGWTDYDKKQMTKAGLEKSKSYMKATYSKTVYVYDTSG